MLLAPSTETTTALTDGLLALAALAAIARLRHSTPPSVRRTIWLALFGCMAAASTLGALAHGVTLPPALQATIWHPLFLLLGTAVALAALGAVGDSWGESRARRLLPALLAVAVGFYLLTRLTEGNFLVFVLFEAGALLFAAITYARLALRDRRPGAGLMTLALSLSLAAGALQALPVPVVTIGWAFDHNAIFHLVQLLAIPVQVRALRELLQAAPGRP